MDIVHKKHSEIRFFFHMQNDGSLRKVIELPKDGPQLPGDSFLPLPSTILDIALFGPQKCNTDHIWGPILGLYPNIFSRYRGPTRLQAPAKNDPALNT